MYHTILLAHGHVDATVVASALLCSLFSLSADRVRVQSAAAHHLYSDQHWVLAHHTGGLPAAGQRGHAAPVKRLTIMSSLYTKSLTNVVVIYTVKKYGLYSHFIQLLQDSGVVLRGEKIW